MIKIKNAMNKKDVIIFVIGILTSAFLTAVDLFTKQIIIDKVLFNSEIVVIKDFFSITHIRNTGAAWGIFSTKTDILSIVTIVCSALVVYFMYAATVNKPVLFCLSSILAGACGNLIERIKLHYVTEWWKQLYGESEGKQYKGLFPAGVDYTTDLHSMGQYVQEGERHLFETVINIKNPYRNITFNCEENAMDKLGYLNGKTMAEANRCALEGTIIAHTSGYVPNIVIEIEKLDEKTIGELLYFFEKACGISGYMLGVNPFNQPGVEAYKKEMFRLLGKN